MKEFTYKNPTEIIFGEGKIANIGELIKPYTKRLLLTYGGGSIKKNGIYDIVINSLRENEVDFIEYSGIKPNPVLSHAKAGIELVKAEKIDTILAVGGGSVIDESKAIAIGACYDNDVWDFFSGEAIPNKALKVFTVLTVPAAGSEMNGGMVITNEETQDKFGFGTSVAYPVASILDPTATLSLPVQYTTYAAVDIFAHATEAYFTKEDKNSFVIDRAVEGVIKSLIESTNAIVMNPQDIDARANFMWTATLAWNGCLNCGVGFYGLPNHIIEHPISAVYDVAHGAGLGIVIPAWMQYFSSKYQDRFALFARNVFGVIENDDAKAAILCREMLIEWFKSINIGVSFSEIGIVNPDLDRLATLALNVMGSKGEPFMVKEDIIKVLEIANS